MVTLGEALKDIRMKRALTLEQAARKIGITRQYLSMIEKGERKSPSFENVVSISIAYGISLDELKQYVISPQQEAI
jgi:transcriptional regulator with XRE-family HTH domain